MRISKLAAFCFGLGLFIGGAASLGLLIGFQPSRLPAALLDVAAYKLAFVAAFALFGVGAVVTRYQRRTAGERSAKGAAGEDPPRLPLPDAEEALGRAARPRAEGSPVARGVGHRPQDPL